MPSPEHFFLLPQQVGTSRMGHPENIQREPPGGDKEADSNSLAGTRLA